MVVIKDEYKIEPFKKDFMNEIVYNHTKSI